MRAFLCDGVGVPDEVASCMMGINCVLSDGRESYQGGATMARTCSMYDLPIVDADRMSWPWY